MGIGRIRNGILKPGSPVAIMLGYKKVGQGKINEVFGYEGLEKVSVNPAEDGNIVIVTGIEEIGIGVTIAQLDNPIGLPIIPIDEPTLNMDFMVVTSPLSGKESKFVTNR